MKDLTGYGPTLVILGLLVFLTLRLAPTIKETILALADKWKEVRMRQMDVDEKIAGVLGGLGEVLRAIAVDQRRATESLEVLQRVNDLDLQTLSDRVERLEGDHDQPNRARA